MAISVLVGLPIAGLGLLLVVPAAQYRSAAVALLLIPTVLVAWAIILFVRLSRHGEFKGGLRGWILAFYTVAGTVSIWATTWNFSREGIRDQIFSPWITLAVALFFFLPFVHLLLFCKTTSTKQDMINEDMQQQNGDVSQKQTHSAEVQEDKVPAPRRLKKCLRRFGQWLCVIIPVCFAFCCLVLYQIRRHNPSYCDSACTSVEVDANTIAMNLADYFSIPAHTSLGPTPIFIGPQACMKNGIQPCSTLFFLF